LTILPSNSAEPCPVRGNSVSSRLCPRRKKGTGTMWRGPHGRKRGFNLELIFKKSRTTSGGKVKRSGAKGVSGLVRHLQTPVITTGSLRFHHEKKFGRKRNLHRGIEKSCVSTRDVQRKGKTFKGGTYV